MSHAVQIAAVPLDDDALREAELLRQRLDIPRDKALTCYQMGVRRGLEIGLFRLRDDMMRADRDLGIHKAEAMARFVLFGETP
jgi:hypothetical protein